MSLRALISQALDFNTCTVNYCDSLSITSGPGIILDVGVSISLKEVDLPTVMHPGKENRACDDTSPICPLISIELASHILEA